MDKYGLDMDMDSRMDSSEMACNADDAKEVSKKIIQKIV